MPASIKTVGDFAFFECCHLERVYISDLAAWCGIKFGSRAWPIGMSVNPLDHASDGLYLNGEKISGLLVIPDGVSKIESNAFELCRDITSVVIPNSVTNIGDWAFYCYNDLTSVMMKGDCPVVGDNAFRSIGSSCVVRLPNENATYDLTNGKWQGMNVAWYGEEGEMVSTANGQMLNFVATSENETIRTSTVEEGTAAADIVIMSGANDVTKGYSRKVEGTTATIALLNPYEVPKEEGAADAPWTEDGEGNVTL